MKSILKINFTDFWENFDKTDNFFYFLLSKKYAIEISDNPDFLFYSCYGREYLKYNCIRIFYASENVRPDFLKCDYAIGFDYINRKEYFRFPLYNIYIDGHHYYNSLVEKITTGEAKKIWEKKTKFCCMLVSNPNSTQRIDFYKALSKVQRVDSGGRYLNNIGYNVKDKIEFIKDYKFVFAFENSSYPGYTTEKILEPLVAKCIPIYWGNPLIEQDFDSGCFINANHYDDYDDLIKKITELNENDELAIEMLVNKKVSDNSKDHLLLMEELSFFIDMIIDKRKFPVARNKFVSGVIIWKKLLKKLRKTL